jgi:hypothetical protein
MPTARSGQRRFSLPLRDFGFSISDFGLDGEAKPADAKHNSAASNDYRAAGGEGAAPTSVDNPNVDISVAESAAALMLNALSLNPEP